MAGKTNIALISLCILLSAVIIILWALADRYLIRHVDGAGGAAFLRLSPKARPKRPRRLLTTGIIKATAYRSRWKSARKGRVKTSSPIMWPT